MTLHMAGQPQCEKGETAEEVRSARGVASGMLQNMQQTVTESWSAISMGHNEFV